MRLKSTTIAVDGALIEGSASMWARATIGSRTAASSTIVDGRYRFALAGRDPGLPGYDWLDTEGRGFGLFVMRFLQSETDPALPEVRVIPLGESQ